MIAGTIYYFFILCVFYTTNTNKAHNPIIINYSLNMGMNETTKQKLQVGMLLQNYFFCCRVTKYLDKLYEFWVLVIRYEISSKLKFTNALVLDITRNYECIILTNSKHRVRVHLLIDFRCIKMNKYVFVDALICTQQGAELR